MVTHMSFLLTPLIALLLCAPKYIDGTMTPGEVVQAAAAFVVVQGAFSWITDSSGAIAEWTASANRIATAGARPDRWVGKFQRFAAVHLERQRPDFDNTICFFVKVMPICFGKRLATATSLIGIKTHPGCGRNIKRAQILLWTDQNG